MSDLPQRLRDRAFYLDRFSDEELVLEAADALEAQAKEIAELRAALAAAREDCAEAADAVMEKHGNSRNPDIANIAYGAELAAEAIRALPSR